jgi:hypothetical protein
MLQRRLLSSAKFQWAGGCLRKAANLSSSCLNSSVDDIGKFIAGRRDNVGLGWPRQLNLRLDRLLRGSRDQTRLWNSPTFNTMVSTTTR